MPYVQTGVISLVLTIPLLYLMTGVLLRMAVATQSGRWLRAVPVMTLIAASASILVFAFQGFGEMVRIGWFAVSSLQLVILLLVCFIGLIICRYSDRYLDGEPSRNHYFVALYLTLGSVTLVLASDHMLMILAGWVGISLCLDQLIRFYPDRPRAVLAAHKKFIFARLAELLLLIAFVLLRIEHSTWSVSEILSDDPAKGLTLVEQSAALLIAAAALVKCAQLPVHGWLMQVVEAPTPVSALLHAGVVNLGGYLLILFGPLLMQSLAAQWLILVIAGCTAVLASLIMATRVSIKVKLAWSTCAQMGLMLIQCALGLFSLALLHLVAHSCLKAYAFLNAGSTVEQALDQAALPRARPGFLTWAASAVLAALMVYIAASQADQVTLLAPWLVLLVAMTVLLAERSSRSLPGRISISLTITAVCVVGYVLQTHVFSRLVQSAGGVSVWSDAWVSSLVLVLLGGHLLIRNGHDLAISRKLVRWLYAGLYLDEWSTRVTLALWPLRLPVHQKSQPTNTNTTAKLEVTP